MKEDGGEEEDAIEEVLGDGKESDEDAVKTISNFYIWQRKVSTEFC